MSTLKTFTNYETKDVSNAQTNLKKMQTEFSESATRNGFAADGCHTVCEVQVVIGHDGKPQPTVVCRYVCDF